MYDKNMIVENECKNVGPAGKFTGFQVGERIPYYRGVVISLLGETRLSVDGVTIPSEKITLTVSGKTLPLSQALYDPLTKWEFGDVGILTVDQAGGLQAGPHTIKLYQHVKTPYIPGGVAGEDVKEIEFSR